MANYGCKMSIIVNANSEEEATAIYDKVYGIPGVTDCDIEEGPEELPEQDDDDDDE